VEYLIALLVVLLILAIVVRPAVSVLTIHDYQRGLRFRNGRLVGLLSSGTQVSVRPFNEIHVIDGRPTALTVPGQEILTADGVALKVSLTARYVVADPVSAFTNDQSYVNALYLALHSGLRDAISGRTADEILAARAELGPAVAASVASELARIGVELLGVDVRDVMVPGELKRAFAGIVAARREGEAALERARGETAALRSLANAGRMLEDNPGLLQLRLLQQVGGSSGNTLMLGLGADGRVAVPPRPPARREDEPPPPDGARGPSSGIAARRPLGRRPTDPPPVGG
jgi:regulator of protease activity HflC (stomatin/prohibitin superfamily)